MDASAWGYLSGIEGLAESLKRAGITALFTDPAVLGSGLEVLRAKIARLVAATLPGSAVIMADAQARVSGDAGACLIAAETGLLEGGGALRLARLDSVPLLVLAVGGGWEEGGPPGDTAPACKGVYQVEAPEEIPSVMAQAVGLARDGEPGPVAVILRRELLRRQGWMRGTGFRQGPRALPTEAEAQLKEIVRLAGQARAIGIYAGAGCFGAADELCALAVKLSAPVVTTISGLGLVPAQHPLAAGFGPPPASSPLAEQVLSNCDLLLAIGCRPQPGTLGARTDAALVLIDADPTSAVPGERWQRVRAPAKQALRLLLEQAPERQPAGVLEAILEGKRHLKRALAGREGWSDAVDPLKVFLQLRELFSAEDTLLLDDGRQAACGVAAFSVQHPRTLLLPVASTAPGWSIPAAVATALLKPDRRVVACVGEGGLMQSAFELVTARRCNIAPVVLVFSPAPQEADLPVCGRLVDRELSRELAPVNLEDLSRALGIGYLSARCDAQLEGMLKQALTAERPVLAEIKVRYPQLRLVEQSGQPAPGRISRDLALRMAARAILTELLE